MHEIEFDIAEVKFYEGEFESVEASVAFAGETLDNDEYGLVYTWEKIAGDDGIVNIKGTKGTYEIEDEKITFTWTDEGEKKDDATIVEAGPFDFEKGDDFILIDKIKLNKQ